MGCGTAPSHLIILLRMRDALHDYGNDVSINFIFDRQNRFVARLAERMLNMRLLIVLATVCLAVQVCVQVEGRYLVEVRLDGYTNPTGGCQDCRCCDGKSFVCTGSNLCDSYFIYCLRPFGDDRQPPVGCSRSSNEYRNTSSINTDDGHLNFSEGTVLGLNNPQILSGLEDPYEVSDHDFIILLCDDQTISTGCTSLY